MMDGQKNFRVRRSALYTPLALLLLAVAAVVFISLFFRVSIIQLQNDTVYTDEELLAASGLEKGANLLFVNNFTAVSSIYATMPYVESVSLRRVMPNRIILAVTGSEAVACVSFGEDYWLINPYGKLLEKIDSKTARSFIRVTGMEPLQPVAGEQMIVRDQDAGKDEYLYSVLSELEERNLHTHVTKMDLSDPTAPVLEYEDRYVVYLSSDEDLAYRLSLLQSAVAQLAEGDAGTLEIDPDCRSNKVYFTPN